MSGHSKWHSIKHKKAAADAKRGKIFTKIIKEIQVAARMGGGDLESNPRLRTAVDAAKGSNMPKDTIAKAIKKGTSAVGGENYEEKTYEGYGPNGVAIFITTLTDNLNRTTGDVRSILSKHGGNLGTSGSVAWMFKKKGIILLDSSKYKEDDIFEMLIEADVENVEEDGEEVVVTTSFENFEPAKKILRENDVEIVSSKIEMIADNNVDITIESAKKLVKLIEKLEDNDDVQDVFVNVDIPEEAME
jgi:YebC/PmpR family DNA-binding regulatory protein